MLPSAPLPHLLLVSAPGDTHADPLAAALRQLGWRVIAVNTAADVATQAFGALACLILLRPGSQETDIIQAALRTTLRHIPVFGEAMILPFGDWGAAPVLLGDDLAAAATQIGVLIAPPAPNPGYPTAQYGAGGVPYPAGGYVFQTPLTGTPSRSPWRMIIGVVVAVVLLACTLGGIALVRTVSVLAGDHPYTAAIPGAGCDHGLAHWTTSTATKVTCNADNVLLAQTTDLHHAAALRFRPPPGTFPVNFRTSVDAQFVSGPHYSAVGITAHHQIDASGYMFYVSDAGKWVLLQQNEHSDINLVRIGFLPKPLTSLTLQVEVAGPLSAFAVNGTRVATIADASLTSSYSLDLLVSSGDEQTPASAQFSHFLYMPLGSSALSQDSGIAATSTALAVPPANGKAYSARVPGMGCDTGGAVWAHPSYFYDDVTQATCSATGLTLSQVYDGGNGSEHFYDLNSYFPANYQVSVQIDLRHLTDGCTGIETRISATGAFHYLVCQDGAVRLEYFKAGDSKWTHLFDGNVGGPLTTVTMTTRDVGATHTLLINGKIVASVVNALTANTDVIDLTMNGRANSGSGSVTFSNFVFTPLP